MSLLYTKSIIFGTTFWQIPSTIIAPNWYHLPLILTTILVTSAPWIAYIEPVQIKIYIKWVFNMCNINFSLLWISISHQLMWSIVTPNGNERVQCPMHWNNWVFDTSIPSCLAQEKFVICTVCLFFHAMCKGIEKPSFAWSYLAPSTWKLVLFKLKMNRKYDLSSFNSAKQLWIWIG